MICLTFDTDWMPDRDMERFLDDFPFPGHGTLFLHDELPSLNKTNHELCPHPFIEDPNTWKSEVSRLEEPLPVPGNGMRPHSCVHSHLLGIGFREMGFKYVSQARNIYVDGISAYRHPRGIRELPISYMYNIDYWTSLNWLDFEHEPFDVEIITRDLRGKSLFEFDFHPLHIALNTRSPSYYISLKEQIIKEGISPSDLSLSGRGTRSFFMGLCDALRDNDQKSHRCSEMLGSLRN